MNYLLAIFMAAFSFLINRWLIRRWEALTIVGLSPAVEESAKTLPALYLGADILTVHLLFGAIEGIYDISQSEKSGAPAGLLSVAGHGIFGALTVFLIGFNSSIILALTSAIIVHIFWNAAVNRLTKI